MDTLNLDTLGAELYINGQNGPATRRRLQRTLILYTVLLLAGYLPAALEAGAHWQAAGLGLWLPGGGFVALGSWYVLLFPLTMLLFLFSLVAWFWAGMVVAPVIVWLGTAMVAGALAGDAVQGSAHVIVALCVAALAACGYTFNLRQAARQAATAERRKQFLPASLAEVQQHCAARPTEEPREMSEDQLASLRYLLDRALQPVEAFEGFDIIDQFQPAALRYQLNHLGFALGIAQGAYLPNFRGYMHRAQQNLIDKYLLRRVWDYWVYESCWGHLNFTNWDPAAKDNIMLTGWFGMQVGQYMLNSGDRQYAQPGSLTFKLNKRTAYRHDFHSIIDSIVQNYVANEDDFCLYPCEPNWLYPLCNHYGMAALASHDRLFGTCFRERFLPSWMDKLNTEFTDGSGSIIGLRSQLTGIRMPFPIREHGYAFFANCFSTSLGQRLWAVARKELEPFIVSGEGRAEHFAFTEKGLDAGNYSPGYGFLYSSILTSAREFGDREIAGIAQESLERDCSPYMDAGSKSYLGASNIANATIAMARFMDTGDFRRSVVQGPCQDSLRGPYLTGIEYPDVLVARACSSGRDLHLVLYPGGNSGTKKVRIEGLAAGARYQVSAANGCPVVVASPTGTADVDVEISGRSEVLITPL